MMHFRVLDKDGKTIYESEKVTKLQGGDGDLWVYVSNEDKADVLFAPGTWARAERVRD